MNAALMSYFVSAVIAGEVILFAVLQAAGRRDPARRHAFGWVDYTLCVGLFAMAGMSLLAYVDTLRKVRELDSVGARYIAASEMISTLKDMETGHRGFLLTGRGSYLAPYRRGLAILPRQEDRLRAVYAGSDRGARVDQICRLAEAKAKEMAQTIALREQGKADEALAQLNSDVGRNTMDLIRIAVGDLVGQDLGRYNGIKAQLIQIAEGRILMASLVALGAVVQMTLGAFGAWKMAPAVGYGGGAVT
jgi:CHASE3 domain sensor protein